MQYAWSGLQMVDETSDSHPDAAVQYIYTENSYEPLARVDSHGEHADIFWYHTELNGLPDSVTDSNGDTVWRGASSAWGRSLRESTPVNWDTPQNLRFRISTWTAKPACTTTPFATTTRRAGVTPRWIR